MQARTLIYYTRCPVPTASGIAFQGGMFAEAFRDSSYEVRNIVELGPEQQNVHYTHSIDAFFREGGAAPPVWARANGVDSVLLGMTFVDEMLGIYVRSDDSATNVTDLAGRRVALPVWPQLIFNFWRVLCLHGLLASFAAYGLSENDVEYVDIVEDWDPNERRNVRLGATQTAARCEYRNQLLALQSGRVDAVFCKGPEAALLEREGEGRIRLLSDLRVLREGSDYRLASIPRLLTTSRRFLEEHPDAVVDYLRTLIRAARWADENLSAATSMLERECGLEVGQMNGYVGPDIAGRFLPRFEADMIESLQHFISFLHRHEFSTGAFDAESWISSAPLADAIAGEGSPQ